MKIMQRFIEKHQHLNDYRPIIIAFLGDSVTHGCFELYNITPCFLTSSTTPPGK